MRGCELAVKAIGCEEVWILEEANHSSWFLMLITTTLGISYFSERELANDIFNLSMTFDYAFQRHGL